MVLINLYSSNPKKTPTQKPIHSEQDKNSFICLDFDFKKLLGTAST